MAGLRIAFRLPIAGWPRALFESDHLFAGGALRVDGSTVAQAANRAELQRGVKGRLVSDEGVEETVMLSLAMDGHLPSVYVTVGGRRAPQEDELRPSATRSAWNHAFLALAASAAGFIASYLYLEKAEALSSLHSLKMAYHMAGWHLLLTVTLFPASVWGQRAGIRAVQATSVLFFAIHLGIALANALAGEADPAALSHGTFWIGLWNAVSGGFFLAAVFYGQTAWRDMDPGRALDASPAQSSSARRPPIGSMSNVR